MPNLFSPLDEADRSAHDSLPDGTVAALDDGILFPYDIDHKLIGACQLDDDRDPEDLHWWPAGHLHDAEGRPAMPREKAWRRLRLTGEV